LQIVLIVLSAYYDSSVVTRQLV